MESLSRIHHYLDSFLALEWNGCQDAVVNRALSSLGSLSIIHYWIETVGSADQELESDAAGTRNSCYNFELEIWQRQRGLDSPKTVAGQPQGAVADVDSAARKMVLAHAERHMIDHLAHLEGIHGA